MCGRYSRAADLDQLARRFGIKIYADLFLKPRYNLAPSEEAPAIIREKGEKRFQMMEWGIQRQWDKARPPLFIINLKAEKLANGPFKSVLAQRRCLIPADGFYEWKAEGKKKMPYRFTLKDDSIFAFPALYDEALPDVKLSVPKFCIFTTEANPLVAPIHHRMPAILPPEFEDAWLDPMMTDVQKVVSMLKPYPPELMKSWAVSSAINSARMDNIDIIAEEKYATDSRA